jgi:hypothetical protein
MSGYARGGERHLQPLSPTMPLYSLLYGSGTPDRSSQLRRATSGSRMTSIDVPGWPGRADRHARRRNLTSRSWRTTAGRTWKAA